MEGTRRERNGCLSCRKRKKKCDGGYPICAQCKRLNLICEREDLRHPTRKVGRPRIKPSGDLESKTEYAGAVVRYKGNIPKTTSVPQSPSVIAFWTNDQAIKDHTSWRRLSLRYYIERFTLLITTTVENNCFLSIFLPMSMDSILLRDATVAWSSTHLSLQNDAYVKYAREYRGIALKSLSASFTAEDHDPRMELASSLIHCALESVTGDVQEWFKHLVGASQIIRSAAPVDPKTGRADLTDFTSTVEGRWLLSNFAYHDVMMTVSEDRKPLQPPDEFGDLFAPLPGVADTYVGFGAQIMPLISRTSVLNVDMINFSTARGVSTEVVDQFAATARAIQSELLAWTCPEAENEELVHMAEAYRGGALIHLYRTLRRHNDRLKTLTTSRIAGQVTNIVDRVQKISLGSLAESSLLFPLFMAGGDAQETQHIAIIRGRMEDIIKTRNFRNFRPSLDVLEETWHLKGLGLTKDDGSTIDWKDVIKRKGWMLSIT